MPAIAIAIAIVIAITSVALCAVAPCRDISRSYVVIPVIASAAPSPISATPSSRSTWR